MKIHRPHHQRNYTSHLPTRRELKRQGRIKTKQAVDFHKVSAACKQAISNQRPLPPPLKKERVTRAKHSNSTYRVLLTLLKTVAMGALLLTPSAHAAPLYINTTGVHTHPGTFCVVGNNSFHHHMGEGTLVFPYPMSATCEAIFIADHVRGQFTFETTGTLEDVEDLRQLKKNDRQSFAERVCPVGILEDSAADDCTCVGPKKQEYSCVSPGEIVIAPWASIDDQSTHRFAAPIVVNEENVKGQKSDEQNPRVLQERKLRKLWEYMQVQREEVEALRNTDPMYQKELRLAASTSKKAAVHETSEPPIIILTRDGFQVNGAGEFGAPGDYKVVSENGGFTTTSVIEHRPGPEHCKTKYLFFMSCVRTTIPVFSVPTILGRMHLQSPEGTLQVDGGTFVEGLIAYVFDAYINGPTAQAKIEQWSSFIVPLSETTTKMDVTSPAVFQGIVQIFAVNDLIIRRAIFNLEEGDFQAGNRLHWQATPLSIRSKGRSFVPFVQATLAHSAGCTLTPDKASCQAELPFQDSLDALRKKGNSPAFFVVNAVTVASDVYTATGQLFSVSAGVRLSAWRSFTQVPGPEFLYANRLNMRARHIQIDGFPMKANNATINATDLVRNSLVLRSSHKAGSFSFNLFPEFSASVSWNQAQRESHQAARFEFGELDFNVENEVKPVEGESRDYLRFSLSGSKAGVSSVSVETPDAALVMRPLKTSQLINDARLFFTSSATNEPELPEFSMNDKQHADQPEKPLKFTVSQSRDINPIQRDFPFVYHLIQGGFEGIAWDLKQVPRILFLKPKSLQVTTSPLSVDVMQTFFTVEIPQLFQKAKKFFTRLREDPDAVEELGSFISTFGMKEVKKVVSARFKNLPGAKGLKSVHRSIYEKDNREHPFLTGWDKGVDACVSDTKAFAGDVVRDYDKRITSLKRGDFQYDPMWQMPYLPEWSFTEIVENVWKNGRVLSKEFSSGDAKMRWEIAGEKSGYTVCEAVFIRANFVIAKKLPAF